MDIKIGDRVTYNSKLYKITYIYDNGGLKLESIRGKDKEIIFNVPWQLITKA